MGSETLHLSVPDYQHQWLKEHDVSPSAILQDAIDARMELYGFDIDTWEETYGGSDEKQRGSRSDGMDDLRDAE